MILGLGTDIIEIARIAGTIERQGTAFLDRVFTAQEQAYCQNYQESARHYAGRFAAKEAVAKALGTGIGHTLSWNEVEIIALESGQPKAALPENILKNYGIKAIHVSISHGRDYATAVAIIEGPGPV